MTGEGERPEGDSKIEEVIEAVGAATETVQKTTRSFADAIEAGRQPGAPLDVVANWAREAPIQAIAVAFLIGVIAFASRPLRTRYRAGVAQGGLRRWNLYLLA